MGFFFNEVVNVNWKKHKPVMYDFWETMILGNMIYQGNPMLRHLELTRKEPLKKEHFDRWMELWSETVTEFFSGKNADEAVLRAQNIATLMQYKTEEINRSYL
ncbi:MAG TPA: sec-independent protein translocase TatC [Flavobacteriales bacterium]|nr:sec-independent protein translocase TatC [Flavobacteriales bacterium]